MTRFSIVVSKLQCTATTLQQHGNNIAATLQRYHNNTATILQHHSL